MVWVRRVFVMLNLRMCAAVAALFAAAPAYAVTIDFEDIASSGSYVYYKDSGFSSDGFDFNLSYGFAIDSAYKYTKYYASNNGTDWLMHNSFGNMSVTASDGGSFSLKSVDAGQWKKKKNTRDVVFTGVYADGTSISQTIAAKAQFETSFFTGWDNLSKLSILGNGYSTYDNFVLEAGSVAPVPVPAGVLLLGSAVGLAGIRFRKKRA